jgi:nicotinate phosphoribosyltransferase
MPDNLSIASEEVEIPFSILDTDLYKVRPLDMLCSKKRNLQQLTMQYAVLHHFPDAKVAIKFTNRAPHMLFSRECFEWVQQRVNSKSSLTVDSGSS